MYLASFKSGYSYINTHANEDTQVDKTDKMVHSSCYILSETVLHAHVYINKGFTVWGQGGMWEWMSFVKLSPIYATKETHGIQIFQI